MTEIEETEDIEAMVDTHNDHILFPGQSVRTQHKASGARVESASMQIDDHRALPLVKTRTHHIENQTVLAMFFFGTAKQFRMSAVEEQREALVSVGDASAEPVLHRYGAIGGTVADTVPGLRKTGGTEPCIPAHG